MTTKDKNRQTLWQSAPFTPDPVLCGVHVSFRWVRDVLTNLVRNEYLVPVWNMGGIFALVWVYQNLDKEALHAECIKKPFAGGVMKRRLI